MLFLIAILLTGNLLILLKASVGNLLFSANILAVAEA